jgi:hypothetical protein
MFGKPASHVGDHRFRFMADHLPVIDEWLRENRMAFQLTRIMKVEPHPMGGQPSCSPSGMLELDFPSKAHATLFKLRWC